MPAADGRMRAADVRPADVEAFRTSGVLVMPNFFTAEEAAAMRRSVADLRDRGLMSNLMVDAPAGEPAAENLQMAWLSKHSMLWQCLPWEPRVVAAAERLLGASRSGVGGCEVHYDQSFLKPPSVGAGTSWHTDNGYFRIQDPLKGVGMWIAVDDASIENGTLHVVPGVEGRFPEPAHGRDTRSSLLSCADDIDEEEAVPCELEAGGVVFFCYGVPHCTHANSTATERCAVAYHFITCDEIEQHPNNEVENPRGGARRFLTGARATGGRAEYGEKMGGGRWAAEVRGVLRGEGRPGLPHLRPAGIDGDTIDHSGGDPPGYSRERAAL